MPSPPVILSIGDRVTHRIYANRGAGRVLTIGRTLLRSLAALPVLGEADDVFHQ